MIFIQSALAAGAMLIATHAAAATLIVGNKIESTVSFIDLEIGAEVARRETGTAPHEIAVSPDGARAVVVSYRGPGYTGESLHVFDVASATKIGEIDLKGSKAPHGLKWIPGTSRVIATTEATNDVVIVDVDAGEVVSAIKTGVGAHMIALSLDANIAYAASINGGAFAIIDLEKGKTIRTVEAGSGTEAISVTPDGKEIWVGANNSRRIMIFDSTTFRKIREIKSGGIPIRVEISPDGAVAAVSEFDKNRILIYEVSSRLIRKTIDLAPFDAKAPVTLLFSPDGKFLWAAATHSRKIIEIDTAEWSVVRTLAAGEGSDGLGYSPIDVGAN